MMSNSSSHPAPNSSSLPPPVSFSCSHTPHNTEIAFLLVIVTLLFLLPLFLRVLHLGRDSATRSNLFTFHLVVVETISFLALLLYLTGLLLPVESLTVIGLLVYCLGIAGKPLFHCCTCVERYLAVVHPIRYLGLRGGGAALWNLPAGCVWSLCFVEVYVCYCSLPEFPYAVFVAMFTVSFLLITFCCLSVLRALIRPGPGEGGGDRERVDQSKRRAFWTITAILGALAVNISVFAALCLLRLLNMLDEIGVCVGFGVNFVFSLPSSAVQPLLFLHRAGKIPGCRHSEG